MSFETGRRFYMLSLDHRGSIEKELLDLTTEPDAEERTRISALKEIIYAGFRQAVAEGAPKDACGLLVDEEFGAGIARSAKGAGYTLAMPVEGTGQQEFEFEFGDEFGAHIESFDPTFAKVLVRYNPDGDAQLNRRQEIRLARLTRWLADDRRELLLELLVPATEAQLAQVDGDRDAYDRTLRPALVVRTLAALQLSGVEPRIWKVGGLDDSADCERVVTQARNDGRNEVECACSDAAPTMTGWRPGSERRHPCRATPASRSVARSGRAPCASISPAGSTPPQRASGSRTSIAG